MSNAFAFARELRGLRVLRWFRSLAGFPLVVCALLSACGGSSNADKTSAGAPFTATAGGKYSGVVQALLPSTLDPAVGIPRLEFVAGALGGFGNLDGKGSDARFDNPQGIAIDSVGRRFIVDQGNHIIRKIETDGTVSTFAGSPSQYGAVDGVGLDARFFSPTGIAIDSDDTLYVTDTYNRTIRKIMPDGTVTTLAGQAGKDGVVDGPAATALFRSPKGIAVDTDKTIYVADAERAYVIRKISPDGMVSTFAGAAGELGHKNGVGSEARFGYPQSMVIDSAHNLFVADSTIRKITPDGSVTDFAGNVRVFARGDGIGTAASFEYLRTVTIDRSDTLFVVDGYYDARIRKITPDAEVTTLPVNDPAAAGLNVKNLYHIAADVDGSLTVTGALAVYTISGADTITLLAGSIPEFGLVNGRADEARFGRFDITTPFSHRLAYGIAADPAGNVYVADTQNYRIRKISTSGDVSDFAGGDPGGTEDGVGSAAGFAAPRGLVADAAGNLFVADTINCTIRKITPDGNVTTLAGGVRQIGNVDGNGSDARFYNPAAIAIDAAGNLFIADTLNSAVRILSPSGDVTTLAGRSAGLGRLEGIAVDLAGTVYVADPVSHIIQKISPDGVVTDVAGLRGNVGSTDGAGAQARFYQPRGLAVDPSGNVYVADTYNHSIRKIDPSGNVTTVAGTPTSVGTRFGPLPGSLDEPNAIAVGAPGSMLIMNSDNVVRLVLPP